MSLPDGWMKACEVSENRLRDFTQIEPINPMLCLSTECPAAKIFDTMTPSGVFVRVVNCQFSKCIRRYPEKRDLKYMK